MVNIGFKYFNGYGEKYHLVYFSLFSLKVGYVKNVTV